MKLNPGILLLCSLLWTITVHAQTDSSVISPLVFGTDDIESGVADKDRVVSTASRSNKKLSDLPITGYIISGEDIRLKGYITLTDALQEIPGVKISQPGNAMDGETFLLRGQYGNYYCKVLIDGIPIQPSVTGSIPIGAQLPVSTCVRIEVIPGPASSVYGADAMAGIINIITIDDDASNDVDVQMQYGYNNLATLSARYAGKAGKGKNIFRYTVMGSFTHRDDWQNDYDLGDNYAPMNYKPDTGFAVSPNYVGTAANPQIYNQPHQSRMLGASLSYRGFYVSYNYLYRRDHRALGFNPSFISYADPGTYWGEHIHRLAMGHSMTVRKLKFVTNFSYLHYNTDPGSSTLYIEPLFIQIAKMDSVPPPQLQNIYNNFLTGKRYFYSASDDIYAEHVITWEHSKAFELLGGLTFQYSGNLPLVDYYDQPFKANWYSSYHLADTSDIIKFSPRYKPFNFYNVSGFVQGYFSKGIFTILAGPRFDYNERYGFSFNPRIGVLVDCADRISLRTSFSTAFRYPAGSYYSGNIRIDSNGIDINATNDFLKPERVLAGELGLRFDFTDQLSLDLIGFVHYTDNFMSKNILINPVDQVINIGYVNDSKSEALLGGAQANFRIDGLTKRFRFGVIANLGVSKGFEVLPGSGIKINDYRMQPLVNGYIEFSFYPFYPLYVALRQQFSSSFLERFIQNPLPGQPVQTRSNNGYYRLDLMMRYRINRFFSAFVTLKNLTSMQYAGIDATGWYDDLYYTPQQKFNAQVGFSYSLK